YIGNSIAPNQHHLVIQEIAGFSVEQLACADGDHLPCRRKKLAFLGPQILGMDCDNRNERNDDAKFPAHPVLLLAADAAGAANDNTFQLIRLSAGVSFVVTYIPPSNDPQPFARIRSYAMDN